MQIVSTNLSSADKLSQTVLYYDLYHSRFPARWLTVTYLNGYSICSEGTVAIQAQSNRSVAIQAQSMFVYLRRLVLYQTATRTQNQQQTSHTHK